MKKISGLLRNRIVRWAGGGIAVLVLGVAALYGLARFAPDPASDRAQAIINRVTLHLPFISRLDSYSEVTRNIPYCGGADPRQVLDLYVPRQETTKPWPLVVYIHGGGWRSGNKHNAVLANYGSGIVQQGFALASINYRFAPKATYPAQSSDLSCALTYLRSQARQDNINAGRIVLMGDSAGGQLAALDALKLENRQTIAGVVDLYGVNDLVAQLQRPKTDQNALAYLGSRDLALAKEASPVSYASGQAPPFLIIHGINDGIVNIQQSRDLAVALRAAGARVELIEVRHAGHAFGTASGGRPSIAELSSRIDQFITSVQ
jgi:acetyl esterase/lipase